MSVTGVVEQVNEMGHECWKCQSPLKLWAWVFDAMGFGLLSDLDCWIGSYTNYIIGVTPIKLKRVI